jgi:hypothetical protein
VAQSLKVRKELKKGSLRRKTPAPKAEMPKWDGLSGIVDALRGASSLHREMLRGDLEQPAPPPPPPLCKDCRFSSRDFMGWRFARCHASEGELNLVDGKMDRVSKYCSCERVDYDHIEVCGTAGKFFEPRLPLAARLKAWWPL